MRRSASISRMTYSLMLRRRSASRPGEPLAPLEHQVLRDPRRLLVEVGLLVPGLLQQRDGLVHLLPPHVRAGLKAVGSAELTPRVFLGLQEFADEQLPIGKGLLDD